MAKNVQIPEDLFIRWWKQEFFGSTELTKEDIDWLEAKMKSMAARQIYAEKLKNEQN